MYARLFIVLLLLLTATAAHAGYDDYQLERLPAKPILTFEKVQALIRRKQIQSPDELIAQLPQKYRNGVTLAYQSHSLQFASCEKPRIIFYGPDAKLIMTFAGDKNVAGGNTVEVIEWNESDKRFAFHEIEFTPQGADRSLIHQNAKTCLGCHGGDEPHPNWDPYNGWRGIFGSLSRLGSDIISPGSKEMDCFSLFRKESLGRGRYAGVSVKVIEGKAINNIFMGNDRHSNSQLTELLGILNAKRIARILVDSPNFSQNKYLLAALVSGCFLDENFRALLPKKALTYEQATAEVSTQFSSDLEKRRRAIEAFNNPADSVYKFQDFSTTAIPFVTSWRIAQSLLDYDIADWSLGFTDSSYDFALPFDDFFAGLADNLRTELKKDEVLGQLMAHGSCKTLARKFVTQTSPTNNDTAVQNAPTTSIKPPRALRLCISCHSGPNATAPSISFHTPSALSDAQILKIAKVMNSEDPDIRMPKTYSPLSKDERDQILNYLMKVE